MSNADLNAYFENALREFAVQHFNEQIAQAAEKEAAENEAYLNREAAWYDLKKDIVRQGDILLISVGPAVWKIPAKDEQFVRDVLPVFAKRLRDLEPLEAAEVRRLQKRLSRNRWRLKPADRKALELDIENAKAALERTRLHEPIPRFGIYKTLGGRDVAVHRLYLRCGDDERVAAFDGDLTNFCDVPLRYEVKRNFGLTDHQRKKLAPIYRETVVPNLYVVSSGSNPAHGRMQGDFERDRITPMTDLEHTGGQPLVRPNADLGTRAGTPHGVQDAGKFRPVTAAEIELGGIDAIGQIERHKPAPQSARIRRAGEALDALFEK